MLGASLFMPLPLLSQVVQEPEGAAEPAARKKRRMSKSLTVEVPARTESALSSGSRRSSRLSASSSGPAPGSGLPSGRSSCELDQELRSALRSPSERAAPAPAPSGPSSERGGGSSNGSGGRGDIKDIADKGGGRGGPTKGSTFVPKKRNAERLEFSFTSSQWGIKANMVTVKSGSRFTHPLTITEVAPDSEAWSRGMRCGDKVVGIRTPGCDVRDVKADPKTQTQDVFVEDETRDILLRGGPCKLIVVRKLKQSDKCINKKCGLADKFTETPRGATVVCEGCGTVQQHAFADEEPGGGASSHPAGEWRQDEVGPVHNPLFVKIEGTVQAGRRGASRGSDQAEQRAIRANKRLEEAYAEITQLRCSLELNEALGVQAKFLFKQYFDNKKKIENQSTLVCACVWLACERGGCPRTCKEILAVRDDVTQPALTRRINGVKKELGIEVAETSADLLCDRLSQKCWGLPYKVGRAAAV